MLDYLNKIVYTICVSKKKEVKGCITFSADKIEISGNAVFYGIIASVAEKL